MSFCSVRGKAHAHAPAGASVGKGAVGPAFPKLSPQDIREAFAVPSNLYPPILSLAEAASLVKLRPQTLKRKVCEGLYESSVVRGKPLRFWRDRLVAEVMR